MLRLSLAWLHLIALGIGLGAVVVRGAALRMPLSKETLRRAFQSDALWGVAAALWVITGLWRVFGSTEKATAYYWSNHIFLAKMGLFVLIVILELRSAITLAKWRKQAPSGPEAQRTAGMIAMVSHLQAALVVGVVLAAVAMARGYGAGN